MEERDLAGRIGIRAGRAGIPVTEDVAARLAAYVELLARWNEKINLTAFPLAPPADDALDRLVIESLVAARRLVSADRLLVDIGSGGGSPALPLKIAAPWLRVVLVESKTRKCAFLREAARQLELDDVQVENQRIEELLIGSDLSGTADVVSMRAVRADAGLWTTVHELLKTSGRVMWFTTAAAMDAELLPAAMCVESSEALPGADGRLVVILNGSKSV